MSQVLTTEFPTPLGTEVAHVKNGKPNPIQQDIPGVRHALKGDGTHKSIDAWLATQPAWPEDEARAFSDAIMEERRIRRGKAQG